jgi:dCMP deaminase
VGYNGTPHGLDDDEFPWDTTEDPLTDKHNYVIHAEANAILNYRGSLRELSGAVAYVTLFPCQECAKTLVQAGIREVVYLDDKYADTIGNAIAKSVLDRCGVSYRQIALPQEALE